MPNFFNVDNYVPSHCYPIAVSIVLSFKFHFPYHYERYEQDLKHMNLPGNDEKDIYTHCTVKCVTW